MYLQACRYCLRVLRFWENCVFASFSMRIVRFRHKARTLHQPLSYGIYSILLPHYVYWKVFAWAWDKQCFSRNRTNCLEKTFVYKNAVFV